MQSRNAHDQRHVRLSDVSDYRVTEDDPDPRGWPVVDASRQRVGMVKDLIVDEQAMRVVLLEVEPIGAASGECMHVAADAVDLDEPRHEVILRHGTLADLGTRTGLSADATAAAPAASTAAAAMPAGRAAGRESSEDATLTRAEEELRVGTREVQAGEVVVRKTVDTEHVSQPVSRWVERVRVERRPVTRQAATAEIGEAEIRVPIREEQVVVDKRPVVKEEVVVHKDAVQETEDVAAEVRRERIEVEGDGALTEASDEERRVRQHRAGGGRG